LWSIRNKEASLAWPLLTHERTKWASREEQYRYRTSSRNLEFIAQPTTVDLDETNEISVSVERRATAASV